MTNGTAYSSAHPEVLSAWEGYQTYAEEIRARRNAMQDRHGRALIQQRSGFGHGTRITGFDTLDNENPGDVLGDDKALRVSKTKPMRGYAVPNLSTKAGKALATELAALQQNGPSLPGMPEFVLTGFHCLAPALHERDGVVWAFWGDGDDIVGKQVDDGLWTPQPLSAYYADREARDAATAQETADA